MPAADHPTASGSLRQRRRAVATQEILAAAERHVTEHGPEALSLRAVARGLGMTVQALYHYFPNRDALVTALVARTYDHLTAAVQAAVDAAHAEPADPAEPAEPRGLAACEAYRRWAVDHPEWFQLIFGTPLRFYEAPVEGPTTHAMRRMSALFERELFGGHPRARLAAAEVPPLSAALRQRLDGQVPDGLRNGLPEQLPAPAVYLLMSAWGHMHGLVVLEVFGHTTFLGEAHQAEIYRLAMRQLMADIQRRVAGDGSGGS